MAKINNTTMETTLNRIAFKGGLSNESWDKLVSNLGNDLDKIISIKDVLKSIGIENTIYVLKTVIRKKNVMLFGIELAENVLHFFEDIFPDDKRPRLAIKGAKDYVNGDITRKEYCELMMKAAKAADDVYTHLDKFDFLDARTKPHSYTEVSHALDAASISSFCINRFYASAESLVNIYEDQTKWEYIEATLLKYL